VRTARGISVSDTEKKPSERGKRHIKGEPARLKEVFHVRWSTKGSVGGIKSVAGAGVIVVESKQAGGAGILEVQAGSLRRICDLRHGRFNEPKALIKQTCTGQLVCTILS
jgi:hypothetical protein